MSIESNVSSGNANDPSGKPANVSDIPDSEDKVAYSSYQKLLTEKKNIQHRLEELSAKNKAEEEAKLLKEKEYEKYIALRNEELVSLKSENEKIKRDQMNHFKASELIGTINGEVKKQYLGLIYSKLEDIAVDPSTGLPDKASIAKVAKDIEETYPEIIKRNNGPGLPNDAAKGNNGKLTPEEWKKLPLKEMKERLKDVINK